MKHYVLGFPVCRQPRYTFIFMVEKQNGSPMNIGKMNGIGGKIEASDETPLEAMKREAGEEIGTLSLDWKRIGHMTDGYEWTVHLYKAEIEGVLPDYPAVNDVGEIQIWLELEELATYARNGVLAQNVAGLIQHCVYGEGSIKLSLAEVDTP